MPTATDLVTDLPADFEVFGQAVATSMADLLGGTTGQILTKATNANMDFTWTSPNPGDITGVTAGTGISGGGTSGDVTVTNSMATAIDAKGDLIAGTGADAFARLAVGTNGQVLTADSTAATGLAWASASATSGPAFNVYPTGSAQTISVATWTKVRLNSENFDTDNCFDSTTNYRFTPTKAGYYQLNMAVNTPSDGRVYGKIYKNGSAYTMCWAYNEADSGNSGSGLIYCNGSTDYIEFFVYLYSGNATISAGSAETQCSGVWIRS